ncbi:hypothetical protein XELAEV_18001246mg [Xenopus laevis]|nr:hypothetical protein XELAEV_18001246mg [Xenopus laevis]
MCVLVDFSLKSLSNNRDRWLTFKSRHSTGSDHCFSNSMSDMPLALLSTHHYNYICEQYLLSFLCRYRLDP